MNAPKISAEPLRVAATLPLCLLLAEWLVAAILPLHGTASLLSMEALVCAILMRMAMTLANLISARWSAIAGDAWLLVWAVCGVGCWILIVASRGGT
ncbi:MAG: hypothetical protein NVS2B9_07010 [Myxococcales bacterium]